MIGVCQLFLELLHQKALDFKALFLVAIDLRHIGEILDFTYPGN